MNYSTGPLSYTNMGKYSIAVGQKESEREYEVGLG